MLVIKTGWNSSQATVTLDGVDITGKLAIQRIEVEPITVNDVVKVRLTVSPDLLEVEALPEWVQLKLAGVRDLAVGEERDDNAE